VQSEQHFRALKNPHAGQLFLAMPFFPLNYYVTEHQKKRTFPLFFSTFSDQVMQPVSLLPETIFRSRKVRDNDG